MEDLQEGNLTLQGHQHCDLEPLGRAMDRAELFALLWAEGNQTEAHNISDLSEVTEITKIGSNQ